MHSVLSAQYPVTSARIRPPRCHAFSKALLVLLAAALVACGCRKVSNVTVTGSVVRNGQPLPLSKTGIVQITLMPDVPEDQPYTNFLGEADKTGKFEIPDVPPGKYKIGIEHLDPSPQTDKLGGAFRTENPKVIRDIDGTAPLTLDLSKPDSK
jgi:hypothetical protein